VNEIIVGPVLALPTSCTFYDVDKYNEEEKSKQVFGDLIVNRQMTAIKFNDISCVSNYSTFPSPRIFKFVTVVFSHSCECQVAVPIFYRINNTKFVTPAIFITEFHIIFHTS